MAAAGEAPASCSGGEMAALLGAAPWWLAAVGAWGGAAAGGVPNTASTPLRGVGVAAGARRRGGGVAAGARRDGETGGAGEAAGGGRPVGFGDAGVGDWGVRRGGYAARLPGLGVGLLVGWAEYNEVNGLVKFSGRSGISGAVAQNPNYPN